MTTWIFPARCINVVDGDTMDLVVDLGFKSFRTDRFRLFGVDCYEKNSKIESERDLARLATDRVRKKLILDLTNLEWPLTITTFKDPDNFGRWLASIRVTSTNEDIGETLLREGLAVPYKR